VPALDEQVSRCDHALVGRAHHRGVIADSDDLAGAGGQQ
jgi:hypothetical protein